MPLTKDEQHVDQYARSAGERPRAASKSDGLNFHAAQYTAPKKAAHGATLVARSMARRRAICLVGRRGLAAEVAAEKNVEL